MSRQLANSNPKNLRSRIAIAGMGLLCLLAASNLGAQSIETGFLDRSLSVDGITYDYQIYVPRAYSQSGNWPLILFLHGAGERGDDGMKPTQVGLGEEIRLHPERWPAITIFPQVPAGESWQGGAGKAAMAALDAAIDEFSIDESRLYLTGLSLGGNGTWYLGYQHTERFAALVAVCAFVDLGDRFPAFNAGSHNPYADLAKAVADLPIWIFHGDADPVVPVAESRKMAKELEALGADVRYTELPGVSHNAWDHAYTNAALATWLFQQQLD